MKKLLNKLFHYSKEDSLIRDSAIFFFASLSLSIAGLLFHFFMGRFLGPENYGILGTIFSMFYITLVIVFVIQTTITHFVASYHTKNEEDKINVLLRDSLKRVLVISIVISIILLIASPFISRFLSIPLKYILLMIPLLIFSFLLPVNRGIMQGLEWFKKLGINMTIEGIVKLLFGVILVYFGLQVSGAIMALILSYVIPFFLSFIIIKKYLPKKFIEIDNKSIYNYTLPVTLALFLFTGFYTVDVLLVKHFFSETQAGLYVALSFMGKIIFFGTQSISLVMFPKSVANASLNKISTKIANKAMILVGILGGAGVITYLILPKLAILILYGKQYLPVSNVLGVYGLVMLLFSLSYVLMFYNLSLKRFSFNYILAAFLIIESIILYFYHINITQIVLTLLTLAVMLYASLLVYTYTRN